MMKAPKPRVLVACQEASLLLGLRSLLEQRRYAVLTATTNEQVDEYVLGGYADILVLGKGLRASRFSIPVVPIGQNARAMLAELEETARLLTPRARPSRPLSSLVQSRPRLEEDESSVRRDAIVRQADSAQARGLISSFERRGAWYKISAGSGEISLRAPAAERFLAQLLRPEEAAPAPSL